MKKKMHINHGNWQTSINILASALKVQGASRDGGIRRQLLHSFPHAKHSVIYFHLKFLWHAGKFWMYKMFSNLITSFTQCKDYNLFASFRIISSLAEKIYTYFYILYSYLTYKMRLGLNNPTILIWLHCTLSVKIQLQVSLLLCLSKYRQSSSSWEKLSIIETICCTDYPLPT